MFRVIFPSLCLTFIVFISANSEKSCDTLGTLLYEDLGCRPLKKDDRGCSIQYECDDFTQKDDSCLFKGKNYGVNEIIKNELTYGSCSVGCICDKSVGPPRFLCAVLDCPEWFGSPVKPGCYRKFEVDKCCSVGMNCPSEENPLAECTVDGKQYKEGEKFLPKNTCFRCVCGKNWSGKLELPFCKKISCNTQIDRAEELHKKCAPVYFSKGVLCCPDTWICPSPSDKIAKVNNNVDANSDLTCTYGSKTLKLGEGFQTKVNHFGSDRDVQCECSVPPLLTCKEI